MEILNNVDMDPSIDWYGVSEQMDSLITYKK